MVTHRFQSVLNDAADSKFHPGCCVLHSFPDHEVTGEDRKIPLLKEVFEAFPDTPINVDVKVNNDKLIEEVCILLISPVSSN